MLTRGLQQDGRTNTLKNITQIQNLKFLFLGLAITFMLQVVV